MLVFFSTDPTLELLFQTELSKHCNVDFMGDVDFFLGTAFTYRRHRDGNLSVHLGQSAFTEHIAHRFGIDGMKRVPNMTPWRCGLPIDSIATADPSDPDLARRHKVHQSIVGCINWLSTNTRPDVTPVNTFLASYSQLPSHQHYKSALHCLNYLNSTSSLGLSYHSLCTTTLQAYNHFPNHHDKKA